MKLKDSIAKRVQELCDENNLTVHGLSLKTGVANSTLCDIVKANNTSIRNLCWFEYIFKRVF